MNMLPIDSSHHALETRLLPREETAVASSPSRCDGGCSDDVMRALFRQCRETYGIDRFVLGSVCQRWRNLTFEEWTAKEESLMLRTLNSYGQWIPRDVKRIRQAVKEMGEKPGENKAQLDALLGHVEILEKNFF